MTGHRLKTLGPYWDAVADGRKTFEVRRNDRSFEVGDSLELVREPDYSELLYNAKNNIPDEPQPTLIRTITYVLSGGEFGVEEGCCVLALAMPTLPGQVLVSIPAPPEGYELCDSVSDADAWGEEINGTRALGVMFFARNPDYKEMTEEDLRREEMLTEGGWYRGKDGPDSVNS